jgi:UDP-N-acetylglucosamine 1-carboxyvinyltransferase
MQKLIINQSLNLTGEVPISGSKNAALPIICAAILTDDDMHFTNVPDLRDIHTLGLLLESLGATYSFSNNTLTVNARNINNFMAHYDLVKQMRASVLVLGPLVARFGEALVSLPGGCAIGARPVDQHIKGLEAMGAQISIESGYIKATAKRLQGTRIIMDVVTVGGTENLLMAAVLAEGTTILENCACEPEVTDLANCLIAMGAKVSGVGTGTLVIEGVKKLHGTQYSIIPDRIEAATYAVAAAITQGNLTLTKSRPDTMNAILHKLMQAGAHVDYTRDTVHVFMDKRAKAVDIATAPYPAFPTDAQAQFMTLVAVSEGIGVFSENIFENRFMHVPELCRMGADINVDGNKAIVKGVAGLNAANVMATDLRASASLVLAGMIASGQTILDRVYHLDRGYEKMEEKLNAVGANIIRVKE